MNYYPANISRSCRHSTNPNAKSPNHQITKSPNLQLSNLKKHCLTLDLIDNPALISEYESMHQQVWPSILESIHSSGITSMEIYRTGNRLFMIMETTDDFSFDKKNATDAANPDVQKWEELMWKYQQRIPWATPGTKWVLMDRIFSTKAK